MIRFKMSTTAWLTIGAGVVGVVMALLLFKRSSSGSVDVGSVSEQWMAQHRAGRGDDPQR
jgi:hypothetical protein